MSEQIAWTSVRSVADIIAALCWADPAWMYLERVPRSFLDPAAIDSALRLERLDPATPFDAWERGRIFDDAQELKWERLSNDFHVVYCGATPPGALTAAPVAVSNSADPSYFLWGQSVRPDDRADLGIDPDDPAYIELRIPRVLRYPLPLTARRACVQVHELFGADGTLCYARWAGVSEENP
ncbi:hypothetical protein EKD04_021210 [Chloroflexales bacterium ZM16-3]|nr:hypothetical protein [Chloroflexales bacterium ZM16-3]